MVAVRVGRDVDAVDGSLVDGRRGREELLDLLFGLVSELPSLTVEELDAVVLRRVVRGGDHNAEVEREQGDRRRRQHPGHDRGTAGRDDAAREGVLELDSGRARVAADEDVAGRNPQRSGAPEPLHELRRDELPDDAADAVRAEVPASHDGASLCGRPGALRGYGCTTDRREYRLCRCSHGKSREVSEGGLTGGKPEVSRRALVNASRTAGPCGPCAGRPSCAPP